MSAAPALKRREPAMVEGEFVFTEGDFRKIAAMVHGDAGIALHETKATLVYSRLAKRDRKSTRLNSSHAIPSRMPSSA